MTNSVQKGATLTKLGILHRYGMPKRIDYYFRALVELAKSFKLHDFLAHSV